MRDDATGKTLITCILIQNFGTRKRNLNKKYKRGDLIHEASSIEVLDLKQGHI
jgi:hypothetical protein